ncbi:MAG TPA: ABC transporter permease [Solirubrobacteraceae bacterium]|nr:ABC transporter permease [Solirubrobacteraceae bacterium]
MLRLRPANGSAAVADAVPGRPWWARFGRSGFGAVFGRISSDPLAVAAGVVLLIFLFVAVFGPLLAPYDPTERTRTATGELAYLQPPSSEHLLGTTNLGRDVFSQLLVGARAALIVGGIAALAEAVIGVLLGLVAGYRKGWVDGLVMRALDVAYALPVEPVAIVLLVFLGQSIWTIVLAIVLLSWRAAARVIRAQVLSISARSFVKGARAVGASDRRIMFRHILPNVLPIAVVYLPVGFGNAIIAEAAISFLGFGDPDTITWGMMLHEVFTAGATETAWWWVISPGLAITIVVAAVFFITRAFEDILNPRLIGRS